MLVRALVCAVVVMSLAACGGSASSAPEGGTARTTAEPTTSAAPKNPLPEELQGTWRLAGSTSADPVRLYLRETAYTVSRGVSHSGKVEAEGDVLTFTSICGGSNSRGRDATAGSSKAIPCTSI